MADYNFGVAVTTRDRPGFLSDCLTALGLTTPRDVPLFVVDDGSVPPAKVPAELGATIIRHPVSLGIPAAKNACLEALMGEDVEHMFLFDDDTYPTQQDWYKPYIEGPEPHYQYCWSKYANGLPVSRMDVVYRDSNLIGYNHSMGCMLYIHRDVVNRIGGFEWRFGLGTEEHIEFSRRAHNCDLTTFLGQDVPGSARLFYAADEHMSAVSSMPVGARREQWAKNQVLAERLRESERFVSYRAPRDRVLAFYANSHPDILEGRVGITWPHGEEGVTRLWPLIQSIGRNSGRLVIFHDCFDPAELEPVENHRIECPISPYNQRWITKYQYLRDHPEIRYAWLVDSTDVTMLRDPFPQMQPHTLYCGWETTVVGHKWTRDHSASVTDWVDAHHDEMLLNCGVVGGDRGTLMRVCRKMIDMWATHGGDPLQETIWFNMIAREMNPVTGPGVVTAFKMHHTSDPHAFWCHK